MVDFTVTLARITSSRTLMDGNSWGWRNGEEEGWGEMVRDDVVERERERDTVRERGDREREEQTRSCLVLADVFVRPSLTSMKVLFHSLACILRTA